MAMCSHPLEPIIIIGAGPSGLLLARYLQIHHLPCVIYEKEVSSTARAQGGTLDLHDDTGLKALRVTGLMEEAREMMRSEGEALKLVGMDGKVYMDENSETPPKEQIGKITGRPEIDRTDLRNLLIKSLKPNTIHWDHTLESVKALTKSTYELRFKDRPTPIVTPYLVGADGTFSRIRPLLHTIQPKYTGVTMYDMLIPSTSMTPKLQHLIGSGGAIMLGDQKALMPQMNSRGKCKVYAALRCEESWSDQNPLPASGKVEWVNQTLFTNWNEDLREIVKVCDEESVVVRRIWYFDPNLRWQTDKTGITVMGDAAHVMSPFSGEGVNQALADALELGKTLTTLFTPSPTIPKPFPLTLLPFNISSPPSPNPDSNPTLLPPTPETLHKALRQYEKRMMDRARPYMKESQINLEIAFGEGNTAKAFRNRFYWIFAEAIGGMVFRAPWWALRSFWSFDD